MDRVWKVHYFWCIFDYFYPFPFFLPPAPPPPHSGNAISLIRPEFCQRRGYCNSSRRKVIVSEARSFSSPSPFSYCSFACSLLCCLSLFVAFCESVCLSVSLSVCLQLGDALIRTRAWMPRWFLITDLSKTSLKVRGSIVFTYGVKAELPPQPLHASSDPWMYVIFYTTFCGLWFLERNKCFCVFEFYRVTPIEDGRRCLTSCHDFSLIR